jgi:hypothetical protein
MYTDAFAQDIYPNIHPDNLALIVDASIELLIYIKLLDNLIDNSNQKAKQNFLEFSELICSSKEKFRQSLSHLPTQTTFDEVWSLYVGKSINAISRRMLGRLSKADRAWEMSAFIGLTPYTLLSVLYVFDHNSISSYSMKLEVWQKIIRHTFIAKQIIDDLSDLLEDLRNGTITPFISTLEPYSGSINFIANLHANIPIYCRQALLQLEKVVNLTSTIQAKSWQEICIAWQSDIHNLIKKCSAER